MPQQTEIAEIKVIFTSLTVEPIGTSVPGNTTAIYQSHGHKHH